MRQHHRLGNTLGTVNHRLQHLIKTATLWIIGIQFKTGIGLEHEQYGAVIFLRRFKI